MNMNVSATSSYSVPKKDNPGVFKKLNAANIGLIAGGMAGSAVTLPILPFIQKGLIKVNRSITPAEAKILNAAGDQILKTSGLAAKGVKIMREVPLEDRKMTYDMFKSMPYPKKLLKFLKANNPIYQVLMGRNAFFSPDTNNIVCTNKMALAQFHEIGHAANKYSKFGNIIQTIRPDRFKGFLRSKMLLGTKIPKLALVATAITTAISAIALFKNKKATGEKPVGIVDKTTTAIKNNAGKLAFLSMLTIPLEEGLASLKGQNFAKALINPKLLKKVKIQNAFGLASYVLMAVAAGIATSVAVKVRDKIAQPNTK